VRLGAWARAHQRPVGIGVTVGAVALVAVAVILGWTLFGPGPEPAGDFSSPGPSPSAPTSSAPTETSEPTATSAATAMPTLAFEAPAGILPPNSRAVVVVDALQLRADPGLGAAVVGVASAGEQFLVAFIHGPVMRDGMAWYRLATPTIEAVLWAAAGSGADRYLELLPLRCEEAEPDLRALVHITEWERLACFGDRPLTITGTYGCPVCGSYIPGSYEPNWLASPQNLNYVGWPQALTLHFRPEAGLDAPPHASIVRVTGHFNDPASTTCVMVPGEPPMPVDPVTAELYCREQFVVDAYEIIGTDPDFTSPSAP